MNALGSPPDSSPTVALIGAAARHPELIRVLLSRGIRALALRSLDDVRGASEIDGVVLGGDDERRGGFRLVQSLRAPSAPEERRIVPVVLLFDRAPPSGPGVPDDPGLWVVGGEGPGLEDALAPFLAAVAREDGGDRTPADALGERSRLEAVDQLVRGVAHDFNNILSVVTTLSDLLIRLRPHDDPDLEDLEEILEAARRGSEITRLLSAFSRRRPGPPAPVPMAEYLRGQEGMLARLLSEDTELEWDLAGDDLVVRTDPTRLDQVLLPLIWRRRDALVDGGRVRIRLAPVRRTEGDAGDGRGLPAGPFASLAVTTVPGGVSAPTDGWEEDPRPDPVLVAVRAAVATMGGALRSWYAAGGAQRSEMLLPVEGGGDADPRGGELPGGSETILLVEDHAELRRGMRRALDHLGYRVVDVADGAEAVALMAEGGLRPDLVLSDVVLPSLSGPELRARMHDMGLRVPILFLSGYAHHPTLEHLRASGVPVLTKPVPTPELARWVRAALDAE